CCRRIVGPITIEFFRKCAEETKSHRHADGSLRLCGAAAPPGADPCDGILNDLGLYTRVRGRSFSWRRGAMVRWLIRQPALCGQFAPLTRSRTISTIGTTPLELEGRASLLCPSYSCKRKSAKGFSDGPKRSWPIRSK